MILPNDESADGLRLTSWQKFDIFMPIQTISNKNQLSSLAYLCTIRFLITLLSFILCIYCLIIYIYSFIFAVMFWVLGQFLALLLASTYLCFSTYRVCQWDFPDLFSSLWEVASIWNKFSTFVKDEYFIITIDRWKSTVNIIMAKRTDIFGLASVSKTADLDGLIISSALSVYDERDIELFCDYTHRCTKLTIMLVNPDLEGESHFDVFGSQEFIESLRNEILALSILMSYYALDEGAILKSWKQEDVIKSSEENMSLLPDALFYNDLLPFIFHSLVLQSIEEKKKIKIVS